MAAQAAGLQKALEALGQEVKTLSKEDPSRALQCAQLYARLGPLAPELASAAGTARYCCWNTASSRWRSG
jgi:ATP-dependent DNA helicase DinG